MIFFNRFTIKTIDRKNLETEFENINSKNIDNLSTSEMVKIFMEEDKIPQIAVSNAKKEIALSIDKISSRLRNKGRLFYIGAGTSGRIAVLDSSECPPTFCTNPQLVQTIIAGGIKSLFSSSENAEDNTLEGINELKKRKFNSKDCLLGITAGGTTPFVLSALEYARKLGSLNILLTCVPSEQIDFNFDIVIRLITGAEIIAGSTRLKAGTATKMALNIISTGVMIKLGKVFDNKMIDVSIKNNKLLDRAIRILISILRIDREQSLRLLKESNGSVKLSCLMNLSNLKYQEAKELLLANEDNLRKALLAANVDVNKYI